MDHPGMDRHRIFRIVAVTALLALTAMACRTGADERRQVDEDRTTASTPPTQPGGNDDPDVVDLALVDDPVGIPPDFFGFNAASIVSPVNVERMLDSELWDQLRHFPTRLIRVPSGTAAQWIDWRTGAFIDQPGSPFAGVPRARHGITMTEWADLVTMAGAVPVWDLNVLTSDLDDQIAMLVEAEQLGLPVEFIELGNELWDVRGPYVERFPTGAAYASEMNRWIPAIRQRFPRARIAVAGADPADTTFTELLGDRYEDWNTEVLSTIRDVDAIVIHHYWGLPDDAAPGSDIYRTLTAGLDHWSEATTLTNKTLDEASRSTEDLEVWITEWNQAAHFAPDGPQIWAQALSVVMVAMEHALDTRVGMSLVHNIVDGTGNPHDIGPSTVYPSFTNGENGTDVFGRTALGTALPLLFGAADGNTSVRRLTDGSDGTRSDIKGVVFAGERTDVVLVNPRDRPITVRLPSSTSAALGNDPTLIGHNTAADAPIGWEPTTKVSSTVTRLDDPYAPLTLPRLSISRITADEDQ